MMLQLRPHLGACQGGSTSRRPSDATRCNAARRDILLGGVALTAATHVRPSIAAVGPADASQLELQLEQRVTRFALPNGMVFLVIRRPDAPVVSINTYCSAGAFVEEDGQTGGLVVATVGQAGRPLN